VPEQDLEAIFEPFYRLESARERATGGVGLGLAIVRSCIDACQGTVVCRNRKPVGFEVEVCLPTAQQGLIAEPTTTPAEQTQRHRP
jgi:two-component system sensor histidine kinase CpxA